MVIELLLKASLDTYLFELKNYNDQIKIHNEILIEDKGVKQI